MYVVLQADLSGAIYIANVQFRWQFLITNSGFWLVKFSVANQKNVLLLFKLLEKWLTYKFRVFWLIFNFFGVCVASAFGFAVRKMFLPDISGFSDLKFSVQPLIFCRKKPIYFKPSCFHFYGNLSILDIGYTHQILNQEACIRDGTG